MSDRDPTAPDPIGDLENFSLEGDPVHPLPASEVRRRGDRMRRRRTGVLAVGAAAAVAVIATSSVVAAQNLTGGDDLQPAPRPSPSETTSKPATIPRDFPFFDASAGEVAPTQEATLAKQLDYCGDRPLASLTPVDALSAEVSGGETSEIRTLLLFGDDAAAEAAEAALLASAAACPSESSGEIEVAVNVLPVSADWPGRTIEQKSTAAAAPDFPSYYFVHTLRAGPALLLTSSVLVGEGIQVDRDAGLEQARSNKDAWVTAMEEFGPVAEQSDRPSTGTTIPDDFPLNRDQENIEDGSTPTPARDGTGVLPVPLCGDQQWPVEPAARLLSTADAPEHVQRRELATFPDAATAVDVMSRLRQAVRDCPKEPTTGPGGEQTHWVHTELERDLGYKSLTWSRSFEGGQALGLQVFQLIRVGNAVLALSLTTEGTQSAAAAQADELTGYSRDLASEMCVFTEAGC